MVRPFKLGEFHEAIRRADSLSAYVDAEANNLIVGLVIRPGDRRTPTRCFAEEVLPGLRRLSSVR